ncbi:MAG: heavy metal translocating P-type ATPase [Clostridia bacterium]|nr:heavy metal translocating P-type ATPase [Clostridia bacterium]
MTKRFSLTKRQKKHLTRILLTVLLTAATAALIHFLDTEWWQSLLLVLPVYAYIGYDVLWNALRDIRGGQIFGEKLLMAIATVGALAIGEYVEAVAVLLFFQVGELFESVANASARKSLKALASLCPDEARLLQDGREALVPIDEVGVGSVIGVKVGERVPIDAVVLKGDANLDYSSLTGESVPVYRGEGDRIPAGVVVLDAPLVLRTEKRAEESATARILAMMEDALSDKGKHERFITKFSFVYTPIVVLTALAVAFLLPLFAESGYLAAFPEYLRRALNFLVVSCPCALVISVPLSFFSASGRAAKQGIIFKSNAAIERLASAKTVCFDKTGTLTSGNFTVTEVIPCCELSSGQLLEIAAALEDGSTHPLGRAFESFAIDPDKLTAQKEVRGKGMLGRYDGKEYALGSAALAEQLFFPLPPLTVEGSVLYIAERKGEIWECIGAFVLWDMPKESARAAARRLDRMKIESVILSGDRKETVKATANTLGFTMAFGELLPEMKVAAVQAAKRHGTVVFAGDGINDAPSLAAADVSFAMGSLGSDAAIEAADGVICDDNPEKVPFAIALSRFTLGLVRENLIFAIGIKLLILVLSALGYANLWLAIFADVGVLILAILNAMRALVFERKKD